MVDFLIGVEHRGVENAKRVIDVLDKTGIKSRDFVAIEYTKEDIESVHSGEMERQIKNDIKGGRITVAAAEEVAYKLLLIRNLLSKGCTVIPLDTQSLLRAGAKEHYKLRKGTAENTAKTISKAFQIQYPVREKRWLRVIKQTAPRFVLVGDSHVSLLRKKLNPVNTLSLVHAKRSARLVANISASLARAAYNKKQRKRANRKRRR